MPDYQPRRCEKWNAKEFVKMLKEAAVDGVEFKAITGAGFAHYSTKLGKKFHRDLLKEFVEEARPAGIKTLIYYSLMINSEAWDGNSSWRTRDAKGRDQAELKAAELRPGGYVNTVVLILLLGTMFCNIWKSSPKTMKVMDFISTTSIFHPSSRLELSLEPASASTAKKNLRRCTVVRCRLVNFLQRRK